ncbi:hypothetical protein [Rhodobium gokarnense]|uniref:Holin n=1 Tax=Rhodobium gokarnense TaxID=364296 RepID=A0ABT3HAG4_9HYPH|nr:hypothetical protein [Rhodobium gokarnense]MCW2307392.1 hypothetical protein [Rhodobium gokarnense]
MRETLKRLKGWRTRLSNAAFAVVGLLALVEPQLWAAVVPVKYQGAVLVVSALANILLRQVTTGPAGTKV